MSYEEDLNELNEINGENEELYHYDLKTVDMIVEQVLNGEEPSLSSPELDLDVQRRIRYFKRMSGLVEEGDDDTDILLDEDQVNLVKAKAEQEKRKARRDDVLIIKLSDDIKNKIKEDVSSSIVRPNPNLTYHKTDDELNIDAKRKSILTKLSRIRKCYYNQHDYQNAINIIKEAILYDLETSYPWMGKKEAIRQFNDGKIKFKGCIIPKLYLNFTTEVTDPDLLKGVITGEVILKDSNEKPKMKPRGKSQPVSCDYNVIPKHYVDTFYKLHKQGYNTPISAVIEHNKGIYNRFNMGGFLFRNNTTIKSTNPELSCFDWLQPGAAKKYVRLLNGKKTSLEEICDIINKDNNGMINDHVLSHMRQFEVAINKSVGYDINKANSFSPIVENKEVIELENKILNSIRAYNPNNNNKQNY